MADLFVNTPFFGHSGELLSFKIECEALTRRSIETLAKLIGESVRFRKVIGIPRGGLKLADALINYQTNHSNDPLLIVDDVLTTGRSMQEEKAAHPHERNVIGIVIFARNACPSWVAPLFTMEHFNAVALTKQSQSVR